MTKKQTAKLIATCLEQKINYDPQVVDDTGREWFYVSPLYKKEQKKPSCTQGELVEAIGKLGLPSIKEVVAYPMSVTVQGFVQIRGDRLEIIKECNNFK